MTKYFPYKVNLIQNQLEKLARAVKNNSAITIKLAHNELNGPHELMLTKTQSNKLKKAMNNGVGSDIKISKTQIRKAVRQGSGIWSTLGKYAFKAVKPLVTGALSAVGSYAAKNVFCKGVQSVGAIIVPLKKLPLMSQIENWLTTKKDKIL